jgi:hypothetical protein
VRRVLSDADAAFARDDLRSVESLDELAELVDREPGLCIRYSKGPGADRDRRSVDYESGLALPGLSANPLTPEPWWTRDIRDWLARQICHYVHLQDETEERRPWLLVGETAGCGPDREPLLDPWDAVAWISDRAVNEARERYERNFEVGEDST